MAIEQLGESLLSDIRTRRAKEEKRLRKQQEKDALMSLGVNLAAKIGNEYLENKAVQFFNNKENLDNRIKQNSAFRYSKNDIETYETAEQEGFSYFYKPALAETLPYVKAEAPADASPAQIQHLAHTMAIELAKDRQAAVKARYDAAVDFYTTANGDPNAFDKALLSSQPKNFAQWIVKKGGNFLSGGVTNALDESHIKILEDKADAYMELRKTNPNPKAAFDLVEDYVDKVEWKKTPPKFGEVEEINIVDDFGTSQKINVQHLYDGVNGRVLRTYIVGGKGGELDLGSPEFNKVRPSLQNIPQERINETQMQVVANVREETIDTIADFMEKVSVKNSEDPERIAAAKKDTYGKILLGFNTLQKRFNLPNDVAIQLAAEMEAINIKQKSVEREGFFDQFKYPEIQPGRNLQLTKDGYSPMLALAALEKLETASKAGERINLSNKTVANLRTMILQETLSEEGIAELDVIFTNMSNASKKNYLDWMSQYKIFTAPMGQNGISLVDRFQQTYIPDMILEKDKERSYNARSYR